jgi:hypothetical protein
LKYLSTVVMPLFRLPHFSHCLVMVASGGVAFTALKSSKSFLTRLAQTPSRKSSYL